MAPSKGRPPPPPLLPLLLGLLSSAVEADEVSLLGEAASTLRGRERRLLPDDGRPCRNVALNLMPPPSLKAYLDCFREKLADNSTHDWSVPGADVAARSQCWCASNMTLTMEEYGCCDHPDVYPMCTMDCEPDCTSTLVQRCVQECPSMCLEVGEYMWDPSLCATCDWVKCWPAMKCLHAAAERAVENQELDRTCHEPLFQRSAELENYWDCWHTAPKHTSHWNLMSSVRHCVCREHVARAARNHSCCDSRYWGGGVCEVECIGEEVCNGQEAQTCIHSCQALCPAFDLSPSEECRERCLGYSAACRKYLSCRPPLAGSAGYVCDDGRYPEAASGCCQYNSSGQGCPRLCETHRMWRVDSQRAIPWWARYGGSAAPVVQCSCVDCPQTEGQRRSKLVDTVQESLWDNGQMMLVDIARREHLQLGPNRQMQVLMFERNDKIMSIVGSDAVGDSWIANSEVRKVNDQYIWKITQAARDYPDDGQAAQVVQDREGVKWGTVLPAMILCSCCLVSVVVLATAVLLRQKRTLVQVPDFANSGGQVVIGNPVQHGGEQEGIPVGVATVCMAPMKSPASPSARNLLHKGEPWATPVQSPAHTPMQSPSGPSGAGLGAWGEPVQSPSGASGAGLRAHAPTRSPGGAGLG